MNSRLIAPILFVGALAFACGPHPRQSADAATTTAAATPRKKSPDEQPLATTLDVAVRGDSAKTAVSFALHVTNTTGKSLELDFPSGQTHDFVVLDSTGKEVWRWSRGRMFTQTVQNKLLGSRETVSYEDRWDARTSRGRFTAVAILNSTNFHREKRIELSLP